MLRLTGEAPVISLLGYGLSSGLGRLWIHLNTAGDLSDKYAGAEACGREQICSAIKFTCSRRNALYPQHLLSPLWSGS